MTDSVVSPNEEEGFCHLHVHSEFSSLDGACKIKKLVELAKERGHRFLGLSDHGTLSGLPAFEKECKAAGIQPILGIEIYLTDDRRIQKRETTTWHLGLIARTTAGLQNLIQLNSRAYIEGYFNGRARADWELLERYSDGVIALTGCMAAPVMSALFQGDASQARIHAQRLIGIYGRENVYAEIQDVGIVEQIPADSELAHKLGKFTLSQEEANWELAEIAKDLELPLIATGDVHYLTPEDAVPHDALLCVGTGQMQPRRADGSPDLNARRFSLLPKRYHFRSRREMSDALGQWPEALENTARLAARCDAEIQYGRQMLPRFPIPEEHDDSRAYLRHLCEEGMVFRYGPRQQQSQQQRERLEFELEVIDRMGFNDYFLIIWDFVREAIARGIPSGPGRGSAAGSIVAYCLQVTHLDPLRYGLLFERFLNPDRISMPDVDWDVSIVRRGEMIDYAREKYNALAGCDTAVSQIVTHSMIGAKAALRDAARVLQKPIALANKLSAMVPARPVGVSLRETYVQVAEFRRAFETDPDAKEVITLAGWMEGYVRGEGVHAAGVVIWDQPLETALPLQRKGKDQPITTAWDMKVSEAVGTLKMDFLGLRNLDIIARAVEIVRHTEGIELDPYRLPLDDVGTFEMLARGESIGVFQLESSGMREALRLIKPTEFDDIIALVALYRPGPMAYIPTYAARKHGAETVEYLDPRLEAVTGSTYGISVYQEQLMLTAREIGKFSPGEADTLRKAIGKKNAELMASLKPKFIDGCVANGLSKAAAQQLWDDNERAAEYSFNKSHAACYGLIAYITAYLKHNHPAAYMAALISLNASTKDKVPQFIAEARRMGLSVLPPNLNRSLRDFAVMPREGADPEGPPTERFDVLFGLQAIKGLGANIIGEIRAERDAGGPFRSLSDLSRRVPSLNRATLEKLVLSGALDHTGQPRKGMFAAVSPMLDAAKKSASARQKAFIAAVCQQVAAAREGGQGSLLDPMPQRPAVKLATIEKRGIEAVAKKALKVGEVPAPSESRSLVDDAMQREALRKARLDARRAGAHDIEQEAEAAVDADAPKRSEAARQLTAEACEACRVVLRAEAPEVDELQAAVEHGLSAAEMSREDWPQNERLARERSVLGLFASAHPLDEDTAQWRRYATHPIAGINGSDIGRTVTIVGAVTGLRVLKKRTGERFGIEVELDDPSGARPVTFFDKSVDQLVGELLVEGNVCVVKARVKEDTFERSRDDEPVEGTEEDAGKAVKLEGITAHPWRPEQVNMDPISPLEITLTPTARVPRTLRRLRELLGEHPGPSPVFLLIDGNRHRLKERVSISDALQRELTSVLGGG